MQPEGGQAQSEARELPQRTSGEAQTSRALQPTLQAEERASRTKCRPTQRRGQVSSRDLHDEEQEVHHDDGDE